MFLAAHRADAPPFLMCPVKARMDTRLRMNLIEALERVKAPVAENARPLRVFLACGITPLHLETFLAAHLRDFSPGCRVELNAGLFGDLVGNLELLRPEDFDALAVVIEWSDLD